MLRKQYAITKRWYVFIINKGIILWEGRKTNKDGMNIAGCI